LSHLAFDWLSNIPGSRVRVKLPIFGKITNFIFFLPQKHYFLVKLLIGHHQFVSWFLIHLCHLLAAIISK